MMSMQTFINYIPIKKSGKLLFNKKEEYGMNRRYIIADNFSANIIESLINGNLFTGFLILLDFNDILIGIITMIRLACNTLQMFSPLILEKKEKRKIFLIISRGIFYILNIIGIGLLAFLPVSGDIKIFVLIVLTILAYVVNAVSGPGFAVWQIKSIPLKVRNDYFPLITVFVGTIAFLAAYLASRCIDYFKVLGNELNGFLILRVIAVIVGITDLYFLTKIKEYPYERVGKINLKNIFTEPFKEKKYIKIVIISCLWSFAANIPGPYYTIYLLRDLNVSYSYMSIVNLMYLVSLIFITPFWTRRIKKTSNLKTLRFLVSIFLVHYAGLFFVTKDTLILYPVFVIMAYACLSGINVVFSGLPYMNAPEKNQTNYIGFYSTMNNAAAFFGVQLGSLFIKFSDNIKITLFSMTFVNKQLLMLLTSLIMLAGLLTANNVMKEKKAK